jgi:ferredoxin--NADP+ reductase
MASVNVERVLNVQHWNQDLFSFRTTRSAGLRFESGQFVMIGLHVEGRPLLRAYSIASAHYEEHLEFFSIKVQDGALTSRLQKIAPGHEVLVSRKPTGSLLLSDLKPGRRLLLLCTGTGLAPFLSLVRDPEVYGRFEKVILVHGVRTQSDLAYRDLLSEELQQHEFLGEAVRDQFIYYPTVTREPYRNRGRVTDLLTSGRLFQDLELESLDPAYDRAMVCGSPSMLADTRKLLDERGFTLSAHIGSPGDYVIERAFVEK